MNLFFIPQGRLPGTRAFIKSCPMFRTSPEVRASRLAEVTATDLRNGESLPGDPFPTPGELAELAGVTLAESLEAITILLKSGYIRQDSAGGLTVSPIGVQPARADAPGGRST